MTLKDGDYYCINGNVHDKDSVIVKIIDTNFSKYNKSYDGEDYVFVLFIRIPDHALYCNWHRYFEYGLTVPIDKREFDHAKKLTHEQMVAIEL